jgi:glycosyltransferase involved in cell wall biosynthesis/septal ring factor EnvC (AmiA/AmiB activator)
MPKVSVVMASYNHEKYVAETIESVLSQTYQDFEFIITDDGSSDKTVEVIKRFADPRIKLFCFSNNQGACAAINNCLKEAKGEYIAVINSDDAWLPDKLEKQVIFLDEHPETGAVFSYAQFIDDCGNDLGYEHIYSQIFIQPNRTRFEWLRHFFLSGNCLCHPSVLIRKHCYNEVGFYDERFAQLPDFDFWIRLCMKYDIFIMPENLVKFRLRQNQENASGNTPKNNSRVTLEWSQILKNYLRDEIFNDLASIFPLTQNINEIGLSMKLNEVDRDVAPFFIAMLASRDNRAAHKYFCFDVLYQIYSNKDLYQKLREQYYFDFYNLVNLAWEQDIFGIVALEQSQSQLHQTQGELEQSQSQLHQTQEVLEQYQSQLHQTQEVLEQSQSQLHQTQGEWEQSQSQLHQTQEVLEQSQSQLHQTQGELEQSKLQLHQTQGELEQSKLQLHQTQGELEQCQSQLHQTQEVLEQSQSQLHQTQEVLEQSQSQLHQTQEVLEQSQSQLHQTQEVLEQSQSQLHQTQGELEQSQSQLHRNEEVLQQYQEQLKESRWKFQNCQNELHEVESNLQQTQAQSEKYQIERDETYTLLEESQNQLRKTEDVLNQYQEQLQEEINQLKSFNQKLEVELKKANNQTDQLMKELETYHCENNQTVGILEQYQTQLQETEALLETTQSIFYKTQGELSEQKAHNNQIKTELEQSKTKLQETETELPQAKKIIAQMQTDLDRLRLLQNVTTQQPETGQTQYKILIAEAWYAYQQGNLTQMVNYLKQSLGYAPLSRAQAIIDWIENFSRFASAQGTDLDIYSLTNLPEWQQLVRQTVRSSPAKLSNLADGNGMIPK